MSTPEERDEARRRGIEAAERQSQAVMDLAKRVDPEMEEEALQIAAFLQGALIGTCRNEVSKILPGLNIEVTFDEAGNHDRWFIAETRAGHRIRVTVEPE